MRVQALLPAFALLAGAGVAAHAASGGPDAHGYTWRDSAEPGVSFAWEDIATTGTMISGTGGDDFNTGFKPLSFAFPYYGVRYRQVASCSNGWVSLVDDTSTAFGNAALPAPGAPAGTIAAFWDDLSVPATGSIAFQDFGDHAIVQWTSVESLAAPGLPCTFQVVLHASGAIDVRWLRIGASVSQCTVGIEKPDGSSGLTAWLDAAPGPPSSAYAVEFLPPPPIAVTLDCAGAAPLRCGDAIDADLASGAALQSAYACSPARLDGREQVFRIDVPSRTPMRIWLETFSGSPEIILLDGCDPNGCLSGTGGSITTTLEAGTSYVVVDCAAGDEGAYRLHAECLGFTFCGDALFHGTPSASPDYPSWWMDDGSWLVEGWLYHPFDADDHALRVDGATIYDDRGSPGCLPFDANTHGVVGPDGPAWTQWSAPEARLRLDLEPTTDGGCCGLLVNVTITNTSPFPHFYDYRVFYDTAFGNALVQPPGCSFADAIDGGPVEVSGVRYLTEQDLLALGADACEGQVRMFTAEDPTWLRSSWEMLEPNRPTDMELMAWGDGDTPALQWSGFFREGTVVGDCVGDNSLLLIWRVPPGAGALAPGEASRLSYRIGWGCSFPCSSCESPLLGAGASRVDACRDGILLSWDAATFPGAGRGTYHAYRSETSFADALSRGPFATGLAAPPFIDATAVAGTDYWYVVQAESLDSPGCGTGPLVSGSTDELQLGPVRADPDVTPPTATVGGALRATAHSVSTVDFNWLLAPLPGSGEHYVVRRADDRPQGPFIVVATPGGQAWTDPAAPARFSPAHCWFYDIRVGDACGNVSEE